MTEEPTDSPMTNATNTVQTTVVSSSAKQNVQLSESEVNEYVEWIDDMSKIGSLAIKQTFLYEMYLRTTGQSTATSNIVPLSSEKRWLVFVSH